MDTVPEISWSRLLNTVEHFKSLGYTYVEVPWVVSAEAICSTFPSSSVRETFKDLFVVGSGEQSFVQLQIDGKLPIGKYVTLTPCFRDEDRLSAITYRSFMKVELYLTEISESTYREVITQCFEWFRALSPRGKLLLIPTETGHDIMLNDVEIGSYGLRTFNDTTWMYATALAEPRFSVCKDYHATNTDNPIDFPNAD